ADPRSANPAWRFPGCREKQFDLSGIFRRAPQNRSTGPWRTRYGCTVSSQSLEPHAKRKMNLRRSALGGIRKVIETGRHETGRVGLSHHGVHRIPVEPLERVVVIEAELRFEALLDCEVLVDRGVGPDDSLLDTD